MAISTISIIKGRVLDSASPIAIFSGKKVGGKGGSLDAVFANTVECKRMIKNRNIHYICTLDSKMKEDDINRMLFDAVKLSRL